MTDPLDPVRAVMQSPEDIGQADVPLAGAPAGNDDWLPDSDGTGPDFHIEGDPGPLPDDRAPPGAYDPELPPAARCVGLPLNDLGNARRFVIHFGRDLIFVPNLGWYCWTGQVWSADPDDMVVRGYAQRISALIEAELDHTRFDPWVLEAADELGDAFTELAALKLIPPKSLTDDQKAQKAALEEKVRFGVSAKKAIAATRDEIRSHALSTGNGQRIEQLQFQAQTALFQPVEALDAHPLSVNTLSGVLEFARPAEKGAPASVALVPHDRAQLHTKIMPVSWDPYARCDRFLTELARVQPDPLMRAFLQRWFGLSMTGLTGEQKLVFLHGGGRNMKSVIVDLMAKIMGDYATTAKIESLIGKNRRSGGDATPDLVPLIGARMVRASEPEANEQLQEAKIKELTGGEPILVRALNKGFVEVYPQFKLTITGNTKPEIRGTDDGIWRRVLLVPFLVQIPKTEIIDKDVFDAILWEERDGILQWLADGLLDYLENGLQEPAAVTDATAEYREESDPLGQFLTDCCVVSGEARDVIRVASLTDAFHYWQIERGVGQWKGATVHKRLAAMAKHWRHPASGASFVKGKSSLMQYEGIRLTDLFKDRFDRAPKDRDGRIIGPAPDADPHSNPYEADF
jgi:putative DNA primase/helicase